MGRSRAHVLPGLPSGGAGRLQGRPVVGKRGQQPRRTRAHAATGHQHGPSRSCSASPGVPQRPPRPWIVLGSAFSFSTYLCRSPSVTSVHISHIGGFSR